MTADTDAKATPAPAQAVLAADPKAAAIPPPTTDQLMLAEMKRQNAALERIAATLDSMATCQERADGTQPAAPPTRAVAPHKLRQ